MEVNKGKAALIFAETRIVSTNNRPDKVLILSSL